MARASLMPESWLDEQAGVGVTVKGAIAAIRYSRSPPVSRTKQIHDKNTATANLK